MRITGGQLGGRTLRSVESDRLRPTTDKVRQAVFNRFAHEIEDARFVDLYAGTGSVGLEAVSRGAASVRWVEADPLIHRVLRENIHHLAPEMESGLVRLRVDRFLAAPAPPTATFVWADPPYKDDPAPLVARLAQCGLLEAGGLFLLEHRARTPAPPSTGILTYLDTREYGDTAISSYRAADPLPID